MIANLIIAMTAIDIIWTWYALVAGLGFEANPVMSWFFRHVGIGATGALALAYTCACVLMMSWAMQYYTVFYWLLAATLGSRLFAICCHVRWLWYAGGQHGNSQL